MLSRTTYFLASLVTLAAFSACSTPYSDVYSFKKNNFKAPAAPKSQIVVPTPTTDPFATAPGQAPVTDPTMAIPGVPQPTPAIPGLEAAPAVPGATPPPLEAPAPAPGTPPAPAPAPGTTPIPGL